MTSKIINRYIWLLNQLLMRKTDDFRGNCEELGNQQPQ